MYCVTASFSDKNTDMDLQSVYGNYGYENGMDLWIGGLAEEKLTRSNLGPTFACIIGQTFYDLCTGNRFYWENTNMFTDAQRQTLSQMTIAKVICQNTDNIPNISPHAFEYGIDEVSCDSLPSLGPNNWRDNICNNNNNNNTTTNNDDNSGSASAC